MTSFLLFAICLMALGSIFQARFNDAARYDKLISYTAWPAVLIMGLQAHLVINYTLGASLVTPVAMSFIGHYGSISLFILTAVSAAYTALAHKPFKLRLERFAWMTGSICVGAGLHQWQSGWESAFWTVGFFATGCTAAGLALGAIARPLEVSKPRVSA